MTINDRARRGARGAAGARARIRRAAARAQRCHRAARPGTPPATFSHLSRRSSPPNPRPPRVRRCSDACRGGGLCSPSRGRGVFAKRHRAWARGKRGSGWRHCPVLVLKKGTAGMTHGVPRSSPVGRGARVVVVSFPSHSPLACPAALVSSGGCCLGFDLALRSFECVGDGTPPRRAIPPYFRTARRSGGAATLWAKRACSVWHERSIAWPLSSQGLTKHPPLSFGVARAVAVPRTGASSYSYPDGTAAIRLIVALDLHHPSTLGARLTVVTPLPRSSSRRRRASRYAAGSTRRRRRSNGM